MWRARLASRDMLRAAWQRAALTVPLAAARSGVARSVHTRVALRSGSGGSIAGQGGGGGGGGGGGVGDHGASLLSSTLAPLAPSDLSPDDIDEPDESRKAAAHAHEPSGSGADVPLQGLEHAAPAEARAPMLFSGVELDALVTDLRALQQRMHSWAPPPGTNSADATNATLTPVTPTPAPAPSTSTTPASSSTTHTAIPAAAAPPAPSSSSSNPTHPTRPFLASWSVKEVCSWYLQVEEALQLPRPPVQAPGSTSNSISSSPPPMSFLSLLQKHCIDGARLLCFTSEPALIPFVPPALLSRILYLRGLDTYSPMFQQPLSPDDATNAAGAGGGHDPNMRHLQAILHSTVKIFCTSTSPDFARPWQQQDQVDSTSSGFVISGRRILGNAHGATNATQLRVRKHGDSTKYKATVQTISHEADLVILTVDNDKFWEDLHPLPFGHVPRLQDTVIVVGYPTGGDSICVTKGVVSRILVSNYVHSDEALLTVQIDAAINSGNSGGPVLLNGTVVGVAFQGVAGLQSVGFIIPIPVVQHFLTDLVLHHNVYTGFPSFSGLAFQKLENECLKRYYGLSAEQSGMVVMERAPLDRAFHVLRPGDVVTHIDGIPVADDGSIFFRHGERISARYLPSSKFVGDMVKLAIVRDKKCMEVSFQLRAKQALVPTHLYDTQPSYFILAGLVFTPLSRPYLLDTFGRAWAKRSPIDLLQLTYYGQLSQPDEQVVILSTIFSHDVNMGYGPSFHNIQLKRVNGHSIRHLKSLVSVVESELAAGAPFLRLDFELNRMIILDTKQAQAANQQILQQNAIEHDRSKDLRPTSTDAAATKHDESELELPDAEGEQAEPDEQPAPAGVAPLVPSAS